MLRAPGRAFLRAVALATLAVAAAGVTHAPLASAASPQPARDVDLARFLGRWYVIAHMPGAARENLGAYFEYRRRDDGRIDDVYSRHEQSFDRPARTDARVALADPELPARWKVRESWLSSSERLLLYVSADYRYAIAGDPDGSSAWVLAREPEIAEWSYAGLLARLALQGYDVSKFRRVPHKPEQVGRPGYE
jgi:apolipoprotein D and lipocalin family protein